MSQKLRPDVRPTSLWFRAVCRAVRGDSLNGVTSPSVSATFSRPPPYRRRRHFLFPVSYHHTSTLVQSHRHRCMVFSGQENKPNYSVG
ncbi:hypothetical protein M404DRAFT_383983 [Pisolithus tinctorius Marx 270]|uniref:Uncharacterized protein n=1 Tax=Pisolithus tinctorius Marx 270 TaxID=870435 RepID=A0A0C3IBJ4_PISTI|nr:hypothetical protein M404DRAFT_383983 [Pisolithus tinctorius Marx 270]